MMVDHFSLSCSLVHTECKMLCWQITTCICI